MTPRWRRLRIAAARCTPPPAKMKQLISRFSSLPVLINQRRGRPDLLPPAHPLAAKTQPRSYANRRHASILDILTNDLFAVDAISRCFDRISIAQTPASRQGRSNSGIPTRSTCASRNRTDRVDRLVVQCAKTACLLNSGGGSNPKIRGHGLSGRY